MNFALVGLAKDPKSKMPDADVSVQLLDEAGKPVVPTPLTHNVKDLHVPQVFDLTTMSVVPTGTPLVLNRAGKFMIEIRATDRLGKAEATLRLPLTVIDPGPMLGKVSGD
jgi:hypothetical protein